MGLWQFFLLQPFVDMLAFHGRRIKISELHEEKTRPAFPKLKTSAKSVQTTAEVCADYTCSLYRLQLKSPKSTTYLQI